jgi:hypothetical protein
MVGSVAGIREQAIYLEILRLGLGDLDFAHVISDFGFQCMAFLSFKVYSVNSSSEIESLSSPATQDVEPLDPLMIQQVTKSALDLQYICSLLEPSLEPTRWAFRSETYQNILRLRSGNTLHVLGCSGGPCTSRFVTGNLTPVAGNLALFPSAPLHARPHPPTPSQNAPDHQRRPFW